MTSPRTFSGGAEAGGAADLDQLLVLVELVEREVILSLRRVAEQAREAEVDQLGLRLAAVGLGLADDDVARLDVAVDEPDGVDVVERARQLDEQLDDGLARGGAQALLQRHAGAAAPA